MAWFYLLLAGIMEIGWPLGFKLSQLPGWRWQGITIALACLALSTVLLWFALRGIPLGTAYAVWTGIGAAGTAVLGTMYFNEPTTTMRLFFLTLLIGSILGLKLASSN